MGVAKEEEEDPYGGSTDEESDMETDGVCVCACVCVCVCVCTRDIKRFCLKKHKILLPW